MMMSMESSSSVVEALAFNYVRYGLLVVVNNFWTLVALFTAAVSFWRFNLLPSLARRRLLKSTSSSSAAAAAEPVIISRPIDSESELDIPPSLPVPMPESSCGRDRDGAGVVVKGNRVYTRYCYDDSDDDAIVVEENEEEWLVQEDDKTQRFDVLQRLRLSDLGFYDYLDMRVLDGNVVKLWNNSFQWCN